MGQGFDVIVIGSGFGGAVVSCRLAEAGAKVLVLERGRRWNKETYPRAPTDPWLFQHDKPEKHNGWLDVRIYRGMAIFQGAGVGGGSQCYSSVVMEANPELFEKGWPSEITYNELVPHYEKVRRMMNVRPIPAGQHTQRYKLLQKAAEKLGYADRLQSVPLAISWDDEWNYDLPNPLDESRSKEYVNPQGRKQGTCVHLGDCDIGCPVRAKNTLDLNYIPQAENHGAEVRPLHLVRSIEPDGQGYVVVFDRIENGRLVPGRERAGKVVLAAGSLGSTELLLRCRDEHRTLTGISPQLGCHWSANANVLTPDIYPDGEQVDQGIGPTISSGLDFMDGRVGGQQFYIEDDGFPNLLANSLRAHLRRSPNLWGWLMHNHLRRGLDEKNSLKHLMIWLGEGIDGGDGQLKLRRKWLTPWKKDLSLQWDVARTKPVIDAILEMHQKISSANGAKLRIPLYWRYLRGLLTVHPLGGCKLGTTIEDGVVNHTGQVFGHPNLYVADGAVLPGPTGKNPSMTIAAVAERIAELMVREE